MSADLVTSMAGESEESRGQREQLAKQLDVLTKGSDTCKRFIGVRLLGKIGPCLSFFARSLSICSGAADNDTIQPEPSSNNDSVVSAVGDVIQSSPGFDNGSDEVPEFISDSDA